MKSTGTPSGPESPPLDSRFLGNDGGGCGNDGEGVLYVVATTSRSDIYRNDYGGTCRNDAGMRREAWE